MNVREQEVSKCAQALRDKDRVITMLREHGEEQGDLKDVSRDIKDNKLGRREGHDVI